jgi:hypothetical protein
MNDVSQHQKKESVLKSLAIIGFIGIIILIAWLSIRFVNVIPGAFSSLASLAESVNEKKQTVMEDTELKTITVTSNATLVNAKESVTASWGEANVPGSYTFSYQCTDGVAIDLQEVNDIKSITCDTNYNIGNVTSLTFTIDSEKNRYADVWYTISFLGTNDTAPRASGTTQLTVVNSEIKNVLATTVDNEEEAAEETPEPVVTAEATTNTPAVETTPDIPVAETVKPVPTPTYEQQYTYAIPVSDPNGRVDLGVRYLNTGNIIGSTFVAGPMKQDKAGAIQFEVKNHGSKTSDTWSFSVTLPNGSTYKSKTQTALKPNERAVLTIGFPSVTVSSHTFVVIVTEANDQVSLNDSFQQKVTFAK